MLIHTVCMADKWENVGSRCGICGRGKSHSLSPFFYLSEDEGSPCILRGILQRKSGHGAAGLERFLRELLPGPNRIRKRWSPAGL